VQRVKAQLLRLCLKLQPILRPRRSSKLSAIGSAIAAITTVPKPQCRGGSHAGSRRPRSSCGSAKPAGDRRRAGASRKLRRIPLL